MKLIGLTGPYCAGKNYIATFFEEQGIPVLDVDKLGHLALETQKEHVVRRFGGAILKADGSVDRRALGRRVFGNRAELEALEAIVHPEAARLTREWLSTRREEACVINAALLRKTPVAGRLSAVVLVEAPLWLRALRAARRDRAGLCEIIRRFSSQKQFLLKFVPQYTDIVSMKNAGTGLRPGKDRQKIRIKIEEIARKLKDAPEASLMSEAP